MSRSRKPKPKPRHIEEATINIDRLGRQGDGMGQFDNGGVHVPLTVPGDQARVRVVKEGERARATLLDIVKAGPDRTDPPCPHFGTCGGCRTQHVAHAPYLAWKRDLVFDALNRVALDTGGVVTNVVVIPPGTRRRVTLAACRTRNGLVLGFNERQSTRVVPLTQCVIARPEIAALLTPMHDLLLALLAPRQSIDVAITVLDDGVDLVLVGGRVPDLEARQILAEFVERHDLARISWRETARAPLEPIAHRRAGVLEMGGARVVLPPGGFCQASREGEVALAGLVAEAMGDRQSVADLFCGVGTFGVRLAADRKRVFGWDGDAIAIEAFNRAAGQAGFAHRPQAEQRDLFREPLLPDELTGFDTVIFDPPRAGARAQAVELAACEVPVIVGVSCNPATFARDARLLVDGGYRLERVTPIDQFVWSAHVELVGVFSR